MIDYLGALAAEHPGWFIVAFISLAAVVWQSVQTWRGLASRRWPSVNGWVHASTFGEEVFLTRGGPSTRYTAFVEYTYRVGEDEFTGRRRRFGVQPDATEAQPGQGEWVKVWYNPRRPVESTLETGIRGETWWILSVSLVAAAVSLTMLARD